MNRRTMLIASSVALAPAMAFAQQPRVSAPRMQLQAQPRLLSLTLQDRAEIMRELNTIISAEPRADMGIAEVRFITELSRWAVGQRNRLRFSELTQNLRQSMRQATPQQMAAWQSNLNGAGDDAQLANVDLQSMLQHQQQTLQMMSNIAKMLYDTAMSVIRKLGG